MPSCLIWYMQVKWADLVTKTVASLWLLVQTAEPSPEELMELRILTCMRVYNCNSAGQMVPDQLFFAKIDWRF